MTMTLNETIVEKLLLTWFRDLGYAVAHAPDIAPGQPEAERDDYGQVILRRRLRDGLLPRLISGQVRIEDAERFLDLQERGRRTSADGKHHGPI